MDFIELRLWLFVNGVEKSFIWTFLALRNVPSVLQSRESSSAGSGRLRRRPFTKQEVRSITLAAATLLSEDHWNNFQRLIGAHKIEWRRSVGGTPTWIEYDLDVEGSIEFETLEDIDRALRYTFKLVQSDPVWFTDFENTATQFTDYR